MFPKVHERKSHDIKSAGVCIMPLPALGKDPKFNCSQVYPIQEGMLSLIHGPFSLPLALLCHDRTTAFISGSRDSHCISLVLHPSSYGRWLRAGSENLGWKPDVGLQEEAIPLSLKLTVCSASVLSKNGSTRREKTRGYRDSKRAEAGRRSLVGIRWSAPTLRLCPAYSGVREAEQATAAQRECFAGRHFGIHRSEERHRLGSCSLVESWNGWSSPSLPLLSFLGFFFLF
jgi:hypothetical protein